MEKTVKCLGCGNDEFRMEKHPDYGRYKEACCVKCGRFLSDRNSISPMIGIKIKCVERPKGVT